MSSETITSTEQKNASEPTDDPVIAALSEAYQDDVIDEEAYGDLVEHRLSEGLSSQDSHPRLHDALEWAAVYSLFGLAVLSMVAMIVGAGYAALTWSPGGLIASFLGFTLMILTGPGAFIALEIKRERDNAQ